MAHGKLKAFVFCLLLAQGASPIGAALADDPLFSVARMGVCDYAVDRSDVSKSLRSLYSCKQKVIIITNETGKTLVFDEVVINQKKCKNHLFLDGEPMGPIKAGAKITFATSCNVSRLDLKIDHADYYYLF